jgi:PKHD-type hydroxylase
MKGEWCYYKGILTPEQCSLILEDGLRIESGDAAMGVSGDNSSSYRKSKVRFIKSDDPNFSWLFDILWKLAIQANDTWFGLHISKLSYIQLAEYDESYEGEYKRHHDVFWMNGDPEYHRKLTAVIQLSDPSEYEGGNLELCTVSQTPNADEIRTQGTVFFFPSLFDHQATKVTKGKRYSLACWFDGPKWR